MSLIGNIEFFQPEVADISSYLERMDFLFMCNVIEEEKKVPLFLTLIGGEAYILLKDLVSPDLPSEKSYQELKMELKDRFSPKKIVIAERFRFQKCNQQHGESISTFIVKLKSLSKSCEFGQFLKEALRDRFVCGLSSELIQTKLLSKFELTFDTACTTALSMEMTTNQMKSLQPKESVNKIVKSRSQIKREESKEDSKFSRRVNERGSSQGFSTNLKPYFRCGRNHNARNCPALNWECFICQKNRSYIKNVQVEDEGQPSRKPV